MSGPRILQFGTIGQLGIELMAAARDAGLPVTAISQDVADFTRPDDVVRAVRETEADIVVNAAAYTAVDKAESEEALARTINADTVGAMAQACAARGLPLIHVSTDYVFDGAKPAPYVETDRVNPQNAYGRTKLAGELAVAAATPRHVILRTSWVYSAHGNNFVKTMLRLGTERDTLNVVNDQYGAPTSAANIAAAILSIARALHARAPQDSFGTFHFTDGGETSWYGFAQAILEEAQAWTAIKAQVHPIPTSGYPTPARRPVNSRLDCAKIERVYGIGLVPWRDALTRVLAQLKAQQEAAL